MNRCQFNNAYSLNTTFHSCGPDFDFHLTSRGSAPLAPKNAPGFHKTALTNQAASIPESKIVKSEKKENKMAPPSMGDMDQDQTLLQLSQFTCHDPAVPSGDGGVICSNSDRASVSSAEGDRMLASSVKQNNSSNSITATTTTNTLLDINHSDAKSSVPSTPVSKGFYSDVYSTVFALQSLGDDSWNDYLTKVRAMWDGQFQTRPLHEQNNHSEKSSRDAADQVSALREKQGQGQTIINASFKIQLKTNIKFNLFFVFFIFRSH